MDPLSFIAAILGSWPLFILIVFLVLRKPIQELIRRLMAAGFKGARFDFSREIEEVRTQVEPGSKTTVKKAGAGWYFETLADVSPRAALLEAWLTFEVQAQRSAADLNLLEGRKYPPQMPELFHALKEGELITSEEETALDKLRAVRNEAVHSSETSISKKQAAEYASLVWEIAGRIRERSAKALEKTP